MRDAEYYLERKPNRVDTMPMPNWGLAKDGKRTIIGNDDEFIKAFEAWLSEACQHDRVGVVKTILSNRSKAYNWFCGECGTKLSNAIHHEVAMPVQKEGVTGEQMSERSAKYERKRRDALSLIESEAADRCQKVNRKQYGEYLESDHWREISKKVMRRAQNLCEGCLAQTAEHVHHMTYDHVGNEFAFELIALCADCHERFHGE